MFPRYLNLLINNNVPANSKLYFKTSYEPYNYSKSHLLAANLVFRTSKDSRNPEVIRQEIEQNIRNEEYVFANFELINVMNIWMSQEQNLSMADKEYMKEIGYTIRWLKSDNANYLLRALPSDSNTQKFYNMMYCKVSNKLGTPNCSININKFLPLVFGTSNQSYCSIVRPFCEILLGIIYGKIQRTTIVSGLMATNYMKNKDIKDSSGRNLSPNAAQCDYKIRSSPSDQTKLQCMKILVIIKNLRHVILWWFEYEFKKSLGTQFYAKLFELEKKLPPSSDPIWNENTVFDISPSGSQVFRQTILLPLTVFVRDNGLQFGCLQYKNIPSDGNVLDENFTDMKQQITNLVQKTGDKNQNITQVANYISTKSTDVRQSLFESAILNMNLSGYTPEQINNFKNMFNNAGNKYVTAAKNFWNDLKQKIDSGINKIFV